MNLDKQFITAIIEIWANLLLPSGSIFSNRKEVRQDDKASEQRGPYERGRFLGRTQEVGKGESWKDMPQVKGLKKLIVAGRATETTIWQFPQVHNMSTGCCHIFFWNNYHVL